MHIFYIPRHYSWLLAHTNVFTFQYVSSTKDIFYLFISFFILCLLFLKHLPTYLLVCCSLSNKQILITIHKRIENVIFLESPNCVQTASKDSKKANNSGECQTKIKPKDQRVVCVLIAFLRRRVADYICIRRLVANNR